MSEQSVEKTHTPPNCPKCEKPLDRVLCKTVELYFFEPESGTYDEKPDDIGNSHECPHCNADLSDVFPSGVVSYNTEIDECKSCNHTASYDENCEGCRTYHKKATI